MASLSKFDGLELPASADFHVHLRDGAMMETVVPSIRRGGVNTVYVMPNLIPPLTSASDALAYKDRLQKQDSSGKINYLLTLYLHEKITPAVVKGAKAQGIVGIKSYPAGVTTNSSSGVISYEPFYPVFQAMEQCGMVLNLHGECPSGEDITILNAESSFLPTLKSLHNKFPKLKIVLEHCTTHDAIEAVKECGPNVVGTITPHHLFLTIDDWADDPFCYCKPVAKLPRDREALLKAAVSGSPKFFLGSDSAPHDLAKKKGGRGKTAAGVFTQPYVTQLVLDALELAIERNVISERDVSKEILRDFLGGHGRRFYGITDGSNEKIILRKGSETIQESFKGDGVEVIPFRRGQSTWSVEWK
ncbi:Dihydroorotase [Mollisia scopiformis]|uniref:dihydroorotase n=1 Tax=Mollisia scopiformis TaxID=149040 RepID=A0A194X5Y8_MOLSC|nr:Dihydroorotase [Mollisia scopiformis]KUJ15595.1 Dihydroorotase [Mollisia scopiformis]